MKRLSIAIFLILLALALIFVLGPRPDADETLRFEAGAIDDDPDQWLAAREAAVPELRDGAQKRVLWADPQAKSKTELAIVYVHGFSATSEEIRPVPDRVAAHFGANLFFTRLTGHGRDGPAMAEASMNDWLNDMAEAIAIGKRIGEKVVLITVSTGGTLATWAAAHPRLGDDLAGLVLISPNFEVQGATIGLLNMPWADTLLPLMMGETRSWEPENEAHGRWWTPSYPSRAILPMGALLKTVHGIDKSAIETPALLIYSPDDEVIVPDAVRRAAEAWGGPAQTIEITDADDPSNHVLAGDILSPSTTERVVEAINEWLASL